MDQDVRRGLGIAAIGIALVPVGLLARGMDSAARGAFQVVGFVGVVLLVIGLVIAARALARG